MNDQDRAAQVWNEAKIEHTKYIGLARNRNAAAIIAAYGQEQFRAGIDEFREWSDVAFYPGPNENPDFQAGFMEAVHEVGRIAYRLLAEQEKT